MICVPSRAAIACTVSCKSEALTEGVSPPGIAARFGLDVATLVDPRARDMLDRLGFVEVSGGRLTVTPRGMPVLDAVLGELVHPALVAA